MPDLNAARRIADYAAVGDNCTAALIHRSGAVEWMCAPAFDSDPVFSRLLDPRGGACDLTVDGLNASKRRYLDHTNVLVSEFESGSGLLAVTDFMPWRDVPLAGREESDRDSSTCLVRLLECREGQVSGKLQVRPTFGFALAPAEVVALHTGAWRFSHAGHSTFLGIAGGCASVAGGSVEVSFQLRAGEKLAIALSSQEWRVHQLELTEVERLLAETARDWKNWAGEMRFEGEYRDLVERSALVLKLMFFEPTGALVAAPTTSLPESPGQSLNWDYRFTWLRDATLTLNCLEFLGYSGEAHRFFHFLRRSHERHEELRPITTIFGEVPKDEQELYHLQGFAGSRPVRVGNDAHKQCQLDIFGELVHSAEIYLERATLPANGQKFPDVWPMVCDAANAVCERWREPDEGLWESRIGRRHFTYSKAMCWLALDAAIRIGGRHRAEVPHRWIGEARRVRRFLEHRCVDPQLHCFVQAAGDTEIDASILRLPLLRVIRADDPRMLATVRTIESRLMENGLVLRNRNLEGAQKGEGAFLPCTLWLAANYAMAGRLRHAERLIERVAGCANDLGLLAEEADPSSGELLGNFPQAFTHLALIHAAQLHRRARQGAFQSARTA